MTSLASIRNPFGSPVVADAWHAAAVDVPEINKLAFDTCMEAFERVATGQGSESVLLHGEAGSGKTHLLGRLQHRLVTDAAAHAPDGALRCIFINVKLQTSPDMLWQHLRRRFADDILRVTQGASQLQRLIAHHLAAQDKQHDARAWVMRIRVLSQIQDEHVESLLEEVSQRVGLGFELRRVLSHLIYQRHMAEARGWLRGDPLPEDALAKLGLSTAAEADPEEQAREFILSLCRLAEDSLPIVFCFDQVEALQSHTKDTTPFFRLGRQLADLFDSDNNILLITCMQSAVLNLFKDSARAADWQRLRRRERALDPLDPKLARLLVKRRLDSEPELVKLREEGGHGELWPLTEKDVESFFSDVMRPPARRVLLRAEQIFSERATGHATSKRIAPEVFLESELERRQDDVLRHQRPSDTDQNVRHGLPLIVNALGLDWAPAEINERDVQLAFDGKQKKRVELSVLNQSSMTSLAAALRRLSGRKSNGQHVVVRDPRLPISKSAKKCREYLSELVEQGTRFVEPDVELLALLEAVRTILSDARAGDLTHDGMPMPVETVEKWLRDTLDERLRPLVDALLPSQPEQPAERDATDRIQDLAELLSKRLLLPVEEAAKILEFTPVELEEMARRHPTRFGYLAGPPALLFAYVAPSATAVIEEEAR